MEEKLNRKTPQFYLRCDPMIISSRNLRFCDDNKLFNDATAWMDNEISCDLT